eukprot:Rmarinus@m.12582
MSGPSPHEGVSRRQSLSGAASYHDYGSQSRPQSTGVTSIHSYQVGVGEGATNRHKEEMHGGASNILVAVRVRPMSKREKQNRYNDIVKVLDRKVVVVDDDTWKDDVLRSHRTREKRYAFDYAFEPTATQQEVYNGTSSFLIDGVVNGFNATVFAYGATGAGKTHTMIGTTEAPGMMVLIMEDLFRRVEGEEDQLFTVTMSYLEVYNEMIRDLLSPSPDYLDLREDPVKGMTVVGISEVEAHSSEQVMNLLHMGNGNRTIEPTHANQVSSRSHAVLQVTVKQRDKTADTTTEVRVGKLSLIDLAGSERASVTHNRGMRMIEGANINRSLLALGNCINALGEKHGRGNFVPYRDSKLTRLLKDSLGGNCRTVMIAAVSPSHHCFEDTLNTLKYAHRAKNIKTQVTRNVLNVQYHIHQYTQIIKDLRDEITRLKQRLAAAPSKSEASTAHLDALDADRAKLDLRERELRQREKDLKETERREVAEKEQVNRLRGQLLLSFQERQQLRRNLVDLEDLDLQNQIEIKKRQLEISDWEREVEKRKDLDQPRQSTPSPVARARVDLKKLNSTVAANEDMRTTLEKRLEENENEGKRLRMDFKQHVDNRERRELLELQYKMHGLELENTELGEQTVLQVQSIKDRDVQIQNLIYQLQLRDKIISEQQSALNKEGGPHIEGYVPLDDLGVKADPDDAAARLSAKRKSLERALAFSTNSDLREEDARLPPLVHEQQSRVAPSHLVEPPAKLPLPRPPTEESDPYLSSIRKVHDWQDRQPGDVKSDLRSGRTSLPAPTDGPDPLSFSPRQASERSATLQRLNNRLRGVRERDSEREKRSIDLGGPSPHPTLPSVVSPSDVRERERRRQDDRRVGRYRRDDSTPTPPNVRSPSGSYDGYSVGGVSRTSYRTGGYYADGRRDLDLDPIDDRRPHYRGDNWGVGRTNDYYYEDSPGERGYRDSYRREEARRERERERWEYDRARDMERQRRKDRDRDVFRSNHHRPSPHYSRGGRGADDEERGRRAMHREREITERMINDRSPYDDDTEDRRGDLGGLRQPGGRGSTHQYSRGLKKAASAYSQAVSQRSRALARNTRLNGRGEDSDSTGEVSEFSRTTVGARTGRALASSNIRNGNNGGTVFPRTRPSGATATKPAGRGSTNGGVNASKRPVMPSGQNRVTRGVGQGARQRRPGAGAVLTAATRQRR